MSHRILAAALLVLARHFLSQAGCTPGSTNTITLAASSQSISHISSGSKESSDICSGADIVVFSGVNVNNTSSRFAGNNDGNLQNLLSPSQNQYIINIYRLAPRPVMPGYGTTNNMSGGISCSSNFTFNGDNFINNNGLEHVLTDLPTIHGNLSGAGNIIISGNLTTYSGLLIHAEGPLKALEPLAQHQNQHFLFGSSLLSQGLFLQASPVKAGFYGTKDQILNFSSEGLGFQSHLFKPDFGNNFHLMENNTNPFLSNQLIYNI
jgi:hypothetical protein